MAIGLPDSIAPALVEIGLLCLLIAWFSQNNALARAALVVITLIVTWRYFLWRITDTIPAFALSADRICGITFLSAEILTGIGATSTWVMLSLGLSRSETVTANTAWLLQQLPLVDALICS